ncbi:MAG TPA: dihydrolipoamide acetyltransferase family protein [Chthoniobacterales bacterium]|jgi:pyruvate dehydrogenase E2 component (dihydrolipoamide acetyltransferase)
MPEIQMPKLSDTMTEGTIVSWKKKVGDQVAAGEVLAEIETDKATMEWEATDDGVLIEIYVPEGGKVDVGERIALIGDKGEETAPNDKKKEPEKTAPAKTPEKKATPKAETAPPEKADSGRVKASPLARKIAAEKNVDLTNVSGSGPGGRIVEKDLEGKGAAAKAKKESARINLTGMRKVIADRLVLSLGPIPHFYLNIEIDAEPLTRIRAELKSAGEEEDTAKITINDFILKGAVAAALREPKVNAAFDGDAIIQYGEINLAVAVAIDEGLVTPVIHAAQNKSLREISGAVKDLAHRARNKRMKPEEFQGGTLTVSNLGSYGIDYFSAVINPPQAIILSIGTVVRRPVVSDTGAIVAGHRMKIGMSCDHRVVDGAIGANYLKALRQLLENPSLLLL